MPQGGCSACGNHIIEQRNVMTGYFWVSPKPTLCVREAFSAAQLMLRRAVARVSSHDRNTICSAFQERIV